MYEYMSRETSVGAQARTAMFVRPFRKPAQTGRTNNIHMLRLYIRTIIKYNNCLIMNDYARVLVNRTYTRSLLNVNRSIKQVTITDDRDDRSIYHHIMII